MTDVLVALNAGSSSLKFAIAPAQNISDRVLSGSIERIGSEKSRLSLKPGSDAPRGLDITAPDHRSALETLFAEISRSATDLQVRGVAHRIVHGGNRFTAPVRVTPDVVADIEALVPLAPLHQPHGLAGIKATMAMFPPALQVACFDTAFHANKPWEHSAYALPRSLYDEGIRAYGFHGLACESICAQLQAEGFPLSDRKIAIAHLGNGCSVTAVKQGQPVATSMGFSTLDGLAMGTRCGRLDPGVLLHLMRNGRSAEDIERLLYHQSGLLGLSGLSNDMRDLSASDQSASKEAIAFFGTRLVEEIGRMAAAMGGLDCVVFSGGIGENDTSVRATVADRLAFLPGGNGDGVTYIVKPADEEQVLLASLQTLSGADGRPDA